jgi:hypothetical protein
MISNQSDEVTEQKGEAGYQKDYMPSPLTGGEKSRAERLRDATICNAEVERVTRNIVTAITNPETPEIVRNRIRAYLDYHFHYDWTEVPAAILVLFPWVCRQLSQIPFVPSKEHIEALTGNDRERAISETAGEGFNDFHPVSLTEKDAGQLVDDLLRLDSDHLEEKAKALTTLIVSVGYEPHPTARKNLAMDACHRAYCHTIKYSDGEFGFIRESLAIGQKKPSGKEAAREEK